MRGHHHHTRNSRCEVWCSHLPSVTVDRIGCTRNPTATKTDYNLYMALNATSCPVLRSLFVVDSVTSSASKSLENEWLPCFVRCSNFTSPINHSATRSKKMMKTAKIPTKLFYELEDLYDRVSENVLSFGNRS